jgi:choline-sulfatase
MSESGGACNVLWIATDSVKASALPQYGNAAAVAPAAERIAERGVVFTHAFCQMPKCVPSRPSQLSGRYPHVDGLRALSGKTEAEEEAWHFVLTGRIPNLAALLKGRGYVLCHKGPNHLCSPEMYRKWFDVGMDFDTGRGGARPSGEDDPVSVRMQYGGAVPADFDVEGLWDAEAARQMCDFLRGVGQERFFAYLDLRIAHPPYFQWPPFAERYAGVEVDVPAKSLLEKAPWTERVYRETYGLEDVAPERWADLMRAYWCGVSLADMFAGRVLDALEEAGLGEDTVVVLSADHGDFAGEHGCVEKHDVFLYDCLARLPLIISLPGGRGAGGRCDALVELIDIAPTLAELCGLGVPRSMQGRSLVPLIDGRTAEHRDAVFAMGGVEREAIDRRAVADERYWERFKGGQYERKQQVILDEPDFMMRAKMVRTRTHKLVYRLNGHHELYDLERDPLELENRADDPGYAVVRTALQERLLRWCIESETNLPLIDQVWA